VAFFRQKGGNQNIGVQYRLHDMALKTSSSMTRPTAFAVGLRRFFIRRSIFLSTGDPFPRRDNFFKDV
jgi:hypothetical protein